MINAKSSILSLSRHFTTTPRNLTTKLTFFTKDNCMLCTNAKRILASTIHSYTSTTGKKIELNTVDILRPENQIWFDKYCYDVPVLHIEKDNSEKPIKFMHYFDESKLLKELND